MNKILSSGLVVAFVLSLSMPYALATNCGTAEKATQEEALQKSGEVVNTICPVMGGEIDKDTPYTVEYKGKTIGFCCEACIEKFNEDPDGYLQKLEEQTQEAE